MSGKAERHQNLVPSPKGHAPARIQQPQSLQMLTKDSIDESRPLYEQYQSIVQRAIDMPHTISPSDAGVMQRTIGNKHLDQLMQKPLEPKTGQLGRQHSTDPITSLNALLLQRNITIQPKLVVGPANDKYEQEADVVAQQVAQHITLPDATASSQLRYAAPGRGRRTCANEAHFTAYGGRVADEV